MYDEDTALPCFKSELDSFSYSPVGSTCPCSGEVKSCVFVVFAVFVVFGGEGINAGALGDALLLFSGGVDSCVTRGGGGDSGGGGGAGGATSSSSLSLILFQDTNDGANFIHSNENKPRREEN